MPNTNTTERNRFHAIFVAVAEQRGVRVHVDGACVLVQARTAVESLNARTDIAKRIRALEPERGMTVIRHEGRKVWALVDSDDVRSGFKLALTEAEDLEIHRGGVL